MRILLITPTFAGSLGDMVQRTLTAMGHEVFDFDFRGEAFGPDYAQRRIVGWGNILKYQVKKRIKDPVKQMNRKLVDYTAEIKPDLALVIKGEIVNATAIKNIRQQGVKTVLWYPDTSTRLLSHHSRVGTASLPEYEICFICDIEHLDPQLAEKMQRIEYLTFACDPKLHKKIDLTAEEQTRLTSDICFVGNSHGDWSIRNKILAGLLDFDIKIWGNSWERAAIYQNKPGRFGGILYGNDLVKAYNASKIAININGDYPYLNMRNFETPACGPMLITSDVPDLSRCFQVGEEVVAFSDLDDLRAKLSYYLTHDTERQAIADRGFQRTHAEHTMEHRMTQFLQMAFG